MSDPVKIAIVTTLPTLLTVIGTQYMAWRRSKEHSVKLDAIEGIVNGNTNGLIDANHQLTIANRLLQQRIDAVVAALPDPGKPQ